MRLGSGSTTLRVFAAALACVGRGQDVDFDCRGEWGAWSEINVKQLEMDDLKRAKDAHMQRLEKVRGKESEGTMTLSLKSLRGMRSEMKDSQKAAIKSAMGGADAGAGAVAPKTAGMGGAARKSATKKKALTVITDED